MFKKKRFGSRTPFRITGTLIALNCLVFALELLFLDEHSFVNFLKHFALIPQHVTTVWSANVWLAVAIFISSALLSMLLHSSWMHIITNMLYLAVFGPVVERRLPHFRFAALYVICGLTACLCQYASFVLSDTAIIGASGAIAGVLGAYLAFWPTAKVHLVYQKTFSLSARVYLLIWFILQVFDASKSFSQIGIMDLTAYWEHIGGFACGMLLVGMWRARHQEFMVLPDSGDITFVLRK